MKNILAKICGVLIVTIIGSYKHWESTLDTKESFEKNRNKYEKVVTDVKSHRDYLLKNKENVEMVKSYGIESLTRLGEEFGYPQIFSPDPLVISFTPRTYLYVIRDMDRDYFLSAEEAKNYGLIDRVIEDRAE
jgi:hypothetical protein